MAKGDHLKVFLVPIFDNLALRILALDRADALRIAGELQRKASERILRALDRLPVDGPHEVLEAMAKMPEGEPVPARGRT
jgi:hypothetical protein